MRAKVLWLFPLLAVFLGAGPGYSQCPLPCSQGFINVQGKVVDVNSAPVHKVNLDFFPNSFGIKIATFCDKTNILGNYNTCVYPPDFYRITFNPLYPFNTHLVGKETLNVDLHAPTVLRDILLEFGWVASGQATDSLGKPVDSVRLSVENLVTQRRVYLSTPGNRTDSLGNYRIVIPNGNYRFRYAPAAGRRQVGVQLDTVNNTAGRDTLFNVTIHSGLFISGQILDSTFKPRLDSIPDVTFEIQDTLGKKIFLPRNKSDSAGKFTVVAPPGVFEFLFVPPRDSHFVANRERVVRLADDTTFSQFLQRGVLLTVQVRDSLQRPVLFANLDLFRLFPTPKKMFTPTDLADSAGVIKVAVPPDSYALVLKPPGGNTNFDTLFLPGLVKIFHDTTIHLILPGRVFRPLPEKFTLGTNFPNPFGSQTQLPFAVQEESRVEITIYNLLGQKVRTLRNETIPPGEHVVSWDGKDELGRRVPAGIYFYRMTASGFSKTRKMILIR